jgi:photosystem II stability/assembly factor-like uncharacterized protein
MTQVLLMAGTNKGLFLLRSDEGRKKWQISGPFCETWPTQDAIFDPGTGAIHAAAGSEWFGAAIWTSPDQGKTWSHSSQGLTYGDVEPLKNAWTVQAAHGSLFAGVEPAGVFRSDDGGKTWEHVSGLRAHPTRPTWEPGNAGLILHHILAHPTDANRMWVGISSAGVFATEDGGKTWEARNEGVLAEHLPDQEPETGTCTHSLGLAAGNGSRLYQRNHQHCYRSDDGGCSWTNIDGTLPSTFGFASVPHPRDPDTWYVVPLNGDILGRYVPDGKAQVWRTRDAGASWEKLTNGLPSQNAYFGVLRRAMTADTLPSAGLYFGTSSGEIFASADEGESWACVAEHLPRVSSLSTAVLQ